MTWLNDVVQICFITLLKWWQGSCDSNDSNGESIGISNGIVDGKNLERHTAHTIVSWPNPNNNMSGSSNRL